MKTKSIKTFVARLKRLNAAYARVVAAREKLPPMRAFPDMPRLKINERANVLSADISITERRIINALLKEAE